MIKLYDILTNKQWATGRSFYPLNKILFFWIDKENTIFPAAKQMLHFWTWYYPRKWHTK